MYVCSLGSVLSFTSQGTASERGQEVMQRQGEKEAGAASMIKADKPRRQHVSEEDKTSCS